jgi:PQQ-dependent dehydrogenase (s-GDH family)
MKGLWAGLFFVMTVSVFSATGQTVTGPRGEVFGVHVLADHLSDPWDITYGPDEWIWVTEAKGYWVSRINPRTGEKKLLLDLNSAKNFPRYDKIPDETDGGKPFPQGGLMGLALHPQLLQGKPYVYLAYIWHFNGADSSGTGCRENFGGCYFTTRVVRYEYDTARQTLQQPVTLCDSIPGSNDHNSGRLLIAPGKEGYYLFYTVGDMGAGQYDNAGRPNHAQDTTYYEGKVLRFHTEPDSDTGRYDRWIPNDNPFCTPHRQSAVWSYGHRNAQGITYGVVNGIGRIYAAEHGPFSDDEINIIEKGKNYGHPLVIGYNDDNYNQLAAGVTTHTSLPGVWHTSYPFISSEHEAVEKIGITRYRDPIKSLYPTPHAVLVKLLTMLRDSDTAKPIWASEAPSSIAFYRAAAIPGWKNSLLVTTLKGGKLIRLQLNAKGNGISGDTINYFEAPVRYRDITLSPDGRRLYLAVDSAMVSSGPTGVHPGASISRGSIIEFTYINKGKPVAPELPGPPAQQPAVIPGTRKE